MFSNKPNAAERLRIDQMREYLSGYPVFTPPHMANVSDLTKEQATENFQYFLEHKAERLEAFFAFLRNYHVAPGVDAEGLMDVSSWFSEHGGLLLASAPRGKARHTFLCFDRNWEGWWVSLNVVFDLGTFIGACLVHRRPKLEWHLAHGGGRGGMETQTIPDSSCADLENLAVGSIP